MNDQSRTLHRGKLAGAELREHPAHRLARGADDLADFFLGQREAGSDAVLGILSLPGPVEQETGELFGSRMGETERPKLAQGCLITAAQLLRRPDGGLLVLLK